MTLGLNYHTNTMNVNVQDPFNFFGYGNPIETFGLVNFSAINAFGLVTRGFIWQAYAIWGDAIGPISTTWTLPSGYSTLVTAWASSATVIATTWAPSYFNELPNQEF